MLLDFMLNSSQWTQLQGLDKGIPVSSAARSYLDKSNKLTGLQYEASLVMENNDKISRMDPIVEDAKMFNSFTNACNLLLFGKKNADEAAKELCKNLESAGYKFT